MLERIPHPFIVTPNLNDYPSFEAVSSGPEDPSQYISCPVGKYTISPHGDYQTWKIIVCAAMKTPIVNPAMCSSPWSKTRGIACSFQSFDERICEKKEEVEDGLLLKAGIIS
ncbi:hypothetical protein BCON_0039g00190 [Botryotinia convoluta]|uniref:Uncharacterized protein n=1 Tax=Botryotinia convoluta TaxID=54673 RepID=A0A4Z1IEV5_9HELO|nr:hypothetical protein BCON_0039g00190 [Botryotinia convoluta]